MIGELSNDIGENSLFKLLDRGWGVCLWHPEYRLPIFTIMRSVRRMIAGAGPCFLTTHWNKVAHPFDFAGWHRSGNPEPVKIDRPTSRKSGETRESRDLWAGLVLNCGRCHFLYRFSSDHLLSDDEPASFAPNLRQSQAEDRCSSKASDATDDQR